MRRVISALQVNRAFALKPKWANVDFPSRLVDSLDRETNRVGVTRQFIIKLWFIERLEETAANR